MTDPPATKCFHDLAGTHFDGVGEDTGKVAASIVLRWTFGLMNTESLDQELHVCTCLISALISSTSNSNGRGAQVDTLLGPEMLLAAPRPVTAAHRDILIKDAGYMGGSLAAPQLTSPRGRLLSKLPLMSKTVIQAGVAGLELRSSRRNLPWQLLSIVSIVPDLRIKNCRMTESKYLTNGL
jgi:hypothetical protein